jgi:hypothetical protein
MYILKYCEEHDTNNWLLVRTLGTNVFMQQPQKLLEPILSGDPSSIGRHYVFGAGKKV